MNNERKIGCRSPEARYLTKEERDKVRQETFDKYWKSLGLSSRDVVDTDILDVGDGPLAAFGDELQKRAKERGFSCWVVSIDKEPFMDVRGDGVDYNKNFRISGVSFENLELKRKMEMSEEPQFDTIIAMKSVPIMFADRGERPDKKWSEIETNEVRNRIVNFINSTKSHLKIGGRAIFYPIFKGEVFMDEETGEKRDFSKWRKILEEELGKLIGHDENGQYKYFFQEVDKPDGIHVYERLIIERKR